jgi:hypothetical protein
VSSIRDVDAPFEVRRRSSAQLVDTKQALFALVPWAGLIIASVTFVVLFLMFGSLLVPAKAVVLNLLSLTATFGAMVWIFQDGNLSGVLDFTPTGIIDTTTPILMFCIAFGLSMDYEVFLLSRIKEEHDLGHGNGGVRGEGPRAHRPDRHRGRGADRRGVPRLRHVGRQLHQAVRHRARHGGPARRHGDPRHPRARLHAPRRRGQLVGAVAAPAPPRALRLLRARGPRRAGAKDLAPVGVNGHAVPVGAPSSPSTAAHEEPAGVSS